MSAAEVGAYVGAQWVTVDEALTMTTPDHDGPGAYHGGRWVPMTCATCGRPATRCAHHESPR